MAFGRQAQPYRVTGWGIRPNLSLLPLFSLLPDLQQEGRGKRAQMIPSTKSKTERVKNIFDGANKNIQLVSCD